MVFHGLFLSFLSLAAPDSSSDDSLLVTSLSAFARTS